MVERFELPACPRKLPACSWYTAHLLWSVSRGTLSFLNWKLVGSVMMEPRKDTPLSLVIRSLHGSL